MCDRETAQKFVHVRVCVCVRKSGGGQQKYIRVRKLLTRCHPIVLPSRTLAYLC